MVVQPSYRAVVGGRLSVPDGNVGPGGVQTTDSQHTAARSQECNIHASLAEALQAPVVVQRLQRTWLLAHALQQRIWLTGCSGCGRVKFAVIPATVLRRLQASVGSGWLLGLLCSCAAAVTFQVTFHCPACIRQLRRPQQARRSSSLALPHACSACSSCAGTHGADGLQTS